MLKKVNALKARQNFGQLVEYYRGISSFVSEPENCGRSSPALPTAGPPQRRERLSANVRKVWRSNARPS